MSARPLVLILDDFSEDIATLYRVAGRLTLADARRLALSSQNGSPWAIETSEPAIGPLSVAATAPNSPTHGDWTLRAFHQALREPDAVDLVLIDLDASDGESLRASLQTILGAHTDAATGEVVPTLGKLLESLALPQAMTPTVALAAFSGGLPSNEEAPGLGWLAANAGSIVQPAPNVGQPALNWAMSLPDVVSVGAVDAAGALRFAAGDARTQVDVLADGHVTDPQWGEQFGTSFAAARVAAQIAENGRAINPDPIDSTVSSPIQSPSNTASLAASIESLEPLGGYFYAAATATARGQVTHWVEASPGALPVPDVSITLSAASPSGKVALASAASNSSGLWEIGHIAAASGLQIEASRAYSGTDPAITARDALAALKIALGRNPNPDPDGSSGGSASPLLIHQLVAADADRDGTITTSDASTLLRAAHGASDVMLAGWRFISETALPRNTPANPGQITVPAFADEAPVDLFAGNTTSVHYIGVLVGDVDGSWEPSFAPANLSGSVTEAGNLPNGAVASGKSIVSGALNASESPARIWSVAGSVDAMGSPLLALTTYGTMSVEASTGVWTYTLNNSLAATQALDAGDSVLQRYVVRATDPAGATTDQTVIITINGSNDAPTLNVGDASGVVQEAGQTAATGSGLYYISLASRADLDDAPRFVVSDWTAAGSSSAGGVLTETYTRNGNFGVATLTVRTRTSDGTDQGSTITYALNNSWAETQALAVHQTDYDSFIIQVTDSHENTGKIVTTREAVFEVRGAEDAMSSAWLSASAEPIVIHRLTDSRAVVRVNAATSDADSLLSYRGEIRDAAGVKIAGLDEFEMSATGGSLIGLSRLPDSVPLGNSYSLVVTASPLSEGGLSSTRSFSGVTIAEATRPLINPDSATYTGTYTGQSYSEWLSPAQLTTGPLRDKLPAFLGKEGNDTFEGLKAGYAVSGGAGVDSVIIGTQEAAALPTGAMSIFMHHKQYATTLATTNLSVPQEFADAIAASDFASHQAAFVTIGTASQGRAYVDVETILFAQSASITSDVIDRAFTLRTESGALLLSLSDKADRVVLGGQADNVAAGAGDDLLVGNGNGGGSLIGGLAPAADFLRGGDGDDVLVGGAASADVSQLFGDAGDDVLVAVAGKVEATGGSGRDVFALHSNAKSVQLFIKDFNASVDVIDLAALTALRDAVAADTAATPDQAQVLVDLVNAAITTEQGLEIDLSAWLSPTARAQGVHARLVLAQSTPGGPVSTDGQLNSHHFVFNDPDFAPAGWRTDISLVM